MQVSLAEWLPNIITALILVLAGWAWWRWVKKKDDDE
jgi:hypothetical protein